MKTIGRTGAVVLLAAAVAAGCGTAEAEKPGAEGGPAAKSTQAIPHTCTLLPKAEAEAVAGEPLGEPKKGPEAPASADVTASQCLYASSDGMRSMSVLVRHSKKGDNEPGYARGAMKSSGMTVTDVPGLGDAAFWTGGQLQAFKGRHVQVVVSMIGFERPEERATAAARKLLEKL
jgi:hypothetical protein